MATEVVNAIKELTVLKPRYTGLSLGTGNFYQQLLQTVTGYSNF